MNSVCLIGNLTKDPELRYTPQGTAVSVLSIAVNEGYGDKKETHFFQCQVWGKTAENCNQYLTKGSKVGITGSLRQQRWEKDGNKKSKIIINAQRIEFLTTKNKEEKEDFDFQE